MENPARALSSDGKWVAEGDETGTLAIAPVQDPAAGRSWPTHEGAVLAAAFSPDGSFVASSGMDRRVCVRSVQQGELVVSLPGHRREVGALAFSDQGDRLASASGLVQIGDETPGEIIVWETRTWAPCLVLGESLGSTFGGVVFSRDGRSLYSSTNPLGGVHDGRVVEWGSGE